MPRKEKQPQQLKTDYPYIFTVLLLVGVAITLGGLIYEQRSGKSLLSIASSYISKPSPTPTPLSQNTVDDLPPNITEEQKFLLKPPSPTASSQEKQKHYDALVKNAKEAEAIDLNKCLLPDPLVLKLVNTTEFQVKNTDSVNHTIHLDKNTRYTVPPGESITIDGKLNFGKGAYGYGCDTRRNVVGFILLL